MMQTPDGKRPRLRGGPVPSRFVQMLRQSERRRSSKQQNVYYSDRSKRSCLRTVRLVFSSTTQNNPVKSAFSNPWQRKKGRPRSLFHGNPKTPATRLKDNEKFKHQDCRARQSFSQGASKWKKLWYLAMMFDLCNEIEMIFQDECSYRDNLRIRGILEIGKSMFLDLQRTNSERACAAANGKAFA